MSLNSNSKRVYVYYLYKYSSFIHIDIRTTPREFLRTRILQSNTLELYSRALRMRVVREGGADELKRIVHTCNCAAESFGNVIKKFITSLDVKR